MFDGIGEFTDALFGRPSAEKSRGTPDIKKAECSRPASCAKSVFVETTPGGASVGLASLLRPYRPLPDASSVVLPLRHGSNGTVTIIAAKSGPVASFPLLALIELPLRASPTSIASSSSPSLSIGKPAHCRYGKR